MSGAATIPAPPHNFIKRRGDKSFSRLLGWDERGYQITDKGTDSITSRTIIPADPGWYWLTYYVGVDTSTPPEADWRLDRIPVVAWSIEIESTIGWDDLPHTFYNRVPILATNDEPTEHSDNVRAILRSPNGWVYAFEEIPRPEAEWIGERIEEAKRIAAQPVPAQTT